MDYPDQAVNRPQPLLLAHDGDELPVISDPGGQPHDERPDRPRLEDTEDRLAAGQSPRRLPLAPAPHVHASLEANAKARAPQGQPHEDRHRPRVSHRHRELSRRQRGDSEQMSIPGSLAVAKAPRDQHENAGQQAGRDQADLEHLRW
jgi:hypothetical protein